jgi:hypothetical protein
MTLRRLAALGLPLALWAAPASPRAAATAYDLATTRLVFSPRDTPRCLKCHGMPNFAYRDSVTLRLRDLSVPAGAFHASAHGRLDCQQCHADVKEYPHAFPAGRSPVGCDVDCHAQKDGKHYDHRTEVADLRASAHGKGLTGQSPASPTCLYCHGGGDPHRIATATRGMTVAEKMLLCATCHDDRSLMVANQVDPDAVRSYRRSFHYKAIRFGATNTAVCQDCHAVHRVLPKDDPRSTIAAGRIAKTCGQEKCHPAARMNFSLSGANHLGLRIHRDPVLRRVERFFVLLTVGTMLMLVAGIVLDVQWRLNWMRLAREGGRALARAVRCRVAALAPYGRQTLVVLRKVLVE